jgi:sec-independent protein translocase protein TatC
MFSVWRYVTLGATVIGAILTPSVDPITQIFMSSIIMILYFGGAGIVFLIERSQENITYEDKF